MRLAVGIAVLGSACALSGCGASQRQQVQAKVEQFVTAIARKDYRTLCHQVLAPALLKHLAGARIGCEPAMRIFVDSVHDPTLSPSRVTVSGRTAVVIALAGATGQRATRQAIELVRTGAGWRVTGLGSPAPTRAPARSAAQAPRAQPQTGGDQAPASSLSRPYATMS